MNIYCNRCGFCSANDAGFCQKCGAAFGPTSSVPAISPPAPGALPHYAGFWIRVVAAILDFLLLVAVAFVLRMAVGSAFTVLTMDSRLPLHEVFVLRRIIRIAISVVVAWAYRAGMESSQFQATLGKLGMRLKVTDLAGRRISLGRATGRYFAKYLSLAALGLGYVMVGFDAEKQGLHDRIAGTLVQYRPGPG